MSELRGEVSGIKDEGDTLTSMGLPYLLPPATKLGGGGEKICVDEVVSLLKPLS